MKRLAFKDVGHDKWNGYIIIPNDLNADKIEEIAFREVKTHLASRFPDVEYDAKTNKGIVIAGCHTVGYFQVEHE